MSYEQQGTAYDSGAVGHDRVGRDSAPLNWDSVARRYVERTDAAAEAVETFHVLPATHVAAGYEQDTAGNIRLTKLPAGYKFTPSNNNVHVAAQPARKRFRWPPETHFKGDNAPLVATATRKGLDDLRQLPGFIYLGSPYSLYKGGYDEAAHIVSTEAASLMATGLVVYAPITHGHYISGHGDLPQTWTFWKAQCQPMIDAAASLVVLMMDGWGESVGLTYEIAEFKRAGKPIVYLELTAGRMAA